MLRPRREERVVRTEEVRLLLKGTVLSTLIQNPTRILFFTGKGGVGKTSSACATAISLADASKRVLLVSTDPASNLDEVLGVKLTCTPTAVPNVPGLSALNIDPEQAAHDYRERVVGPYRGFPVTLTTTDPAAHVEQAARELSAGATGLRVTRIDPVLETRRYTEEVMSSAGSGLDAQGKALLEEDLRSPCTEEIAVFRAFAETVAQGEDRFVVIDTAPTGHTLLLLDAAESYHREVLKKPSGSPQAVQRLLPRLRDPEFTRVLLVTLPEATPIHEAMQLERDLARADIRPFAWVVNQSLTPLDVKDPVLRSRQAHEATHLRELADHASHIVLEPWSAGFAGGESRVAAPRAEAIA